jgi:hypothetical protein
LRYWISAQAPPLEGGPEREIDRIPLAEGREAVGLELEAGDLVLVYQPKTGRAARRRDAEGKERWARTARGRQGIVALAEVLGRAILDPRAPRTEYADGAELCWCWHVPIRAFPIDGYAPLADVNRILGFKPRYRFGGFAHRSSGLREIQAGEYWSLVEIFRSNAKTARGATLAVPEARPPRARGPGEEPSALRLLVDYVASDPALALREAGLETLSVDHELPAGESVDIVLEDRTGTFVSVQVERGEDFLATIAHASVRRAMLELELGRSAGQSRAFVVAPSLPRGMRELCASYGVECFAIDGELVRSWGAHRRSEGPGG